MNASDHRWAVILPAGDGRSINGGDPLIRDAIRRARKVVVLERICIVVERDHHRYWWPLGSVSPANLLVQPRNCGTAIGILFAVLEILARDPLAHVLFVPADHSLENEAAVSFAIGGALGRISGGGLELALIAVKAQHPASNLAYIVPGARLQQDVYRVKEFIEKPAAALAQQLCEYGAFWSTSVFSAWAFCVLALLREYLPTIVDAMSSALARADCPSQRIDALAELYERLPTVDFARTVLQKSRSMMLVIHAPSCGWTDQRAPQQLQHALRRWRTCNADGLMPAFDSQP
jgi:mannose-1-phosphate guanylyltransferase